MRLEEYDLMYQVEDRLWWYRGMQAITRALIERHYAPGQGLRILDAGCGTGAALGFLARYGSVTGVDFEPHALWLAQRRSQPRLGCASVAALPFADAAFDLVTSFDVLVMLQPPAEAAALREVARVLAPGGRVLMRVAANDWLRGAHDRAWSVVHRYAPSELDCRLRQVGLVVEHISHANMWLFPVAVVKRLAERLLPASDRSDLGLGIGPLNGLFAALLASEAPLVARRRLPFGLSLVALARKPG